MSSVRDDRQFRTELEGLIPHMRAFARSLCHEPVYADDLAQDALLKAWQHRDGYTPGTNMKAWVFMILRNQFYSDKRRSWRHQPLDREEAERTLIAPSNPHAALELDDVRRGLDCLPPDQREALILVGAGGLSHEEAADVLGCALGTVKSRVSRGRRALNEILSDEAQGRDQLRPSAAMGSILAELDRFVARPLAA